MRVLSILSTFLIALPCVAQEAPATRIDLRVEPLVDLYTQVRHLSSLRSAPAPDATTELLAPAVGAARRLGETLGPTSLNWGALDAHLEGCPDAAALAERFAALPEPVELWGGETASLRDDAVALARELEKIEPRWRELAWPKRREALERRRRDLTAELIARQAVSLRYMLDSLGIADPDAVVPVYLVTRTVWPGAMTYGSLSGGGICFVALDVSEGSRIAETVLHEATHALDVLDRGDSVFERLRTGLIEAGIDRRSRLIRNVPHAIMFIQAAETIRRHVNPDHVAYGENGLYDRIEHTREIILPAWLAYLDGERTREETIALIVERVVEAEASGS